MQTSLPKLELAPLLELKVEGGKFVDGQVESQHKVLCDWCQFSFFGWLRVTYLGLAGPA